ncbi:MAG: SDR family oxidoreductase [Betaproteobacteria bacterium]|nr:SDR family oxidoreductase [Betaproteobacteria bacterium]
MPMSSAVFAYAKLLDARVDGLSQALLLGALSVLFGALGLFLIGPAFFAAGPGYVLTPLVEKQIPDTAKARGMTEEQVKRDVLLAAQPTKRFVSVEQIAATTLFLCSDAAASITGSHIAVEGGWVAQ